LPRAASEVLEPASGGRKSPVSGTSAEKQRADARRSPGGVSDKYAETGDLRPALAEIVNQPLPPEQKDRLLSRCLPDWERRKRRLERYA
jgi:hypothetical protein